MDFEQIYAAYFNDVFRYIRRHESIAEEVTAETFFKAMDSIDRFRGECDIRVWLCQIAKNTYRSYYQSAENGRLIYLEAPGGIYIPFKATEKK